MSEPAGMCLPLQDSPRTEAGVRSADTQACTHTLTSGGFETLQNQRNTVARSRSHRPQGQSWDLNKVWPAPEPGWGQAEILRLSLNQGLPTSAVGMLLCPPAPAVQRAHVPGPRERALLHRHHGPQPLQHDLRDRSAGRVSYPRGPRSEQRQSRNRGGTHTWDTAHTREFSQQIPRGHCVPIL